jgi:hypothetical protein
MPATVSLHGGPKSALVYRHQHSSRRYSKAIVEPASEACRGDSTDGLERTEDFSACDEERAAGQASQTVTRALAVAERA